MLPSNLELLNPISDEIIFILDATAGKTQDEVVFDPILSRAVVRSLEIIGEASAKVHPDFKILYPQIEWRKMSETRNRLIHDYLESTTTFFGTSL